MEHDQINLFDKAIIKNFRDSTHTPPEQLDLDADVFESKEKYKILMKISSRIMIGVSKQRFFLGKGIIFKV